MDDNGGDLSIARPFSVELFIWFLMYLIDTISLILNSLIIKTLNKENIIFKKMLLSIHIDMQLSYDAREICRHTTLLYQQDAHGHTNLTCQCYGYIATLYI